ncbi:hypothetical protein AVV36_gp166 [Pectobacterium bacteriophage PM2]|uniref:Uncharacterized protein n=1 Tax=Pectobacterium bacteriophage PM2 TaxID=1429794 RepID=A0A0A0PZR1_9CAUD|nr:hypothetical protein AVV36_gp166 [Pectobacterium bacteriophage PM2]AHY25244.1 hypothetical protein PM2_282 [Pectobacterium bacteriophage PM2]
MFKINTWYTLNNFIDFAQADSEYNPEIAELIVYKGKKFKVLDTHNGNISKVGFTDNSIAHEDGKLSKELNERTYLWIDKDEYHFFEEVGSIQQPSLKEILEARPELREELDEEISKVLKANLFS